MEPLRVERFIFFHDKKKKKKETRRLFTFFFLSLLLCDDLGLLLFFFPLNKWYLQRLVAKLNGKLQSVDSRGLCIICVRGGLGGTPIHRFRRLHQSPCKHRRLDIISM